MSVILLVNNALSRAEPGGHFLNRITSISGQATAPKYLDCEVRVSDMSNNDNNIVKVNERIVRHRLANHSGDRQPKANPSRDHQPY